jgi:uncharacterized membrane protein
MKDVTPMSAEQRQAIAYLWISIAINAVFYTLLFIFAKGWMVTVFICHLILGAVLIAGGIFLATRK